MSERIPHAPAVNWIGPFINRMSEVEGILRAPTNIAKRNATRRDGQRDELPPPLTPESMWELAAKLSVPAEVEEAAGPPEGVPAITLGYTNWRGEFARRRVVPIRVWFGSTEWHPEPQSLLRVWDMDKGALRDFALLDIGEPRYEPVNGTSEAGVPLHGSEAMRQGWTVTSNPYKGKDDPESKCRRLEWEAEWHGANAQCFRDHVFGGTDGK